MAFNFRLQNVLDYRRTLADRSKAELAATERHLRVEEDLLAELYVAHAQAMTAYQTLPDGPVDVSQSERLTLHLQALEASITNQTAAVERVRATYQHARAQLLELEKDAKSLEKLRDRKQEEHQSNEVLQERRDASETTATFHQRFRASP